MKNGLCHFRLRAGISNLNNGRFPTKSGMTIFASILVTTNY